MAKVNNLPQLSVCSLAGCDAFTDIAFSFSLAEDWEGVGNQEAAELI